MGVLLWALVQPRVQLPPSVPDNLQNQLSRTLGDAYTIDRELGGGGMSRVYVAEDTRLRRKVVIKLLSPELAAGVSAERFEREIQLAAALQQANIVPVLSAGETEGLPWYSMPFIDGLSLRARLARNGAMPVAEVVSVLRDVSRALAYAHEHGIVHRDIKPENIMLAGATRWSYDFGVAKAASIAASAGMAAEGSRRWASRSERRRTWRQNRPPGRHRSPRRHLRGWSRGV